MSDQKPPPMSFIFMLNIIENGVLHKRPAWACGFPSYAQAKAFEQAMTEAADKYMKALGVNAVIVQHEEKTN